MRRVVMFMLPTLLFSDIEYYQESNNTIVTLYPVEQNASILKKVPKDALQWYYDKEGVLLGLKHSFYISTKEINTTIENLCDEYNLSIKSTYGHSIFKVDQNQTTNVLSFIDYINKAVGKLIAHPDFYKKAKRR
jgi:ribosomal protein S11